MKRWLRVAAVLLLLYGGCAVLIRLIVPWATGAFLPGYAPYFTNLRHAAIGWDGFAMAAILASALGYGLFRRKWLRRVCLGATVLMAVCSLQVNTIPLLKIIALATEML